MKRLSCHITMGQLTFNYVSELTINSAWKNFTDSCTIRLPRNLKLREKELLSLIKCGDPVAVKLGYDDINNLEFKGYIRSIKPSTPLEIECEDEMNQLKKNPVSVSVKGTSLKGLINIIAAQYTSEVYDSMVSSFAITKSTPAQVLEKIKEEYGWNSFFRLSNGIPVLHVGTIYIRPNAMTHNYTFGKNIINSTLEFKRKEDIKLKVKAISNKADGSKIEVELGDSEGEERSLNYYNLTKSELEKIASQELEKLKFDGYRGSFEAFGVPFPKHGDVVKLTNPSYPEEDGNYFIDEVQTVFGAGGFHRTLTLGGKA